MRNPWLVTALILLLAPLAPVARAEDNKQVAKQAYLEGQRLFELGEYQKALDSFKRAYLAFDDPAFLFNLGQCYRMLDNKVDAVRSYKQFLRKVPDAPNRVAIEKIVADLEAAIEQDRLARSRPPEGVQAPNGEGGAAAGTSAGASGALTATATRPSERQPAYKKWWVWTIVGGVVVAGVAVGLGVGLASRSGTTLPDFGPAVHSLTVRF
jgi:tetratricopeptide (TPR) repeat protein